MRIQISALGDAQAEGKAEGDLAARFSVAAAMRSVGLSVEKVAALTRLTVEQVRAL